MKIKKFLISLSCIFLLSSCASPYIGRKIDLGYSGVCIFRSFPVECIEQTKHFDIVYEIFKTGEPDEYKITGTAGKIGGTAKTFTEFSESSFILYLIDYGVIVEEIHMAGGRGSFSRPIRFSRTFKTEKPFQATLLDYRMNVRG